MHPLKSDKKSYTGLNKNKIKFCVRVGVCVLWTQFDFTLNFNSIKFQMFIKNSFITYVHAYIREEDTNCCVPIRFLYEFHLFCFLWINDVRSVELLKSEKLIWRL